MRYASKIYAKVIAELSSKKNISLTEKEIDNLKKFIARNNDQKRIKEILNLAEKYILKKQGKNKIVVETPRKISEAKMGQIEETFGTGNIMEEKINSELISGIKLIVNDEKQFDASLARKIKNLF